MLANKSIGFIGGGNMAEAIVGGLLLQSDVNASQIHISDLAPKRLAHLQSKFGVTTNQSNLEIAKRAEIVILAVKPQVIRSVLEELASIDSALWENKLVVSLVAGLSTRVIKDTLGQTSRIVRAMPNTPALVRAGVTVLSPAPGANDSDINIATSLFEAVGTTEVLSEEKMDAVTGLSGSGPAYVFVILEAMADAGVKLGLPRSTALKLATQTVLGSAKLAIETQMHPAQLKDMVASPGGTTIAGLYALEAGGLRTTMSNAIEASAKRSAELGNK